MRSAVRQTASVAQRRRVHEALAETLEAEPDRRVWHRAARIVGTREDVALELEAAGRRARRRGAISVAATALRRRTQRARPTRQAPDRRSRGRIRARGAAPRRPPASRGRTT